MRVRTAPANCVRLSGELALLAGEVFTQGPAIQKLPIGAGAIGKGPDALTPPGYEDVPRPPAFNDAVRKENARIIQLVDNYTPQPAFVGQTRAPKPAKIAAYRSPDIRAGALRPVVVRLPAGRPHPGQRDQQGPAVAGQGRQADPLHPGIADRLHQARPAAAGRRAGQGLRPHAHHLLPLSRAAQGSRRYRHARGRRAGPLPPDRDGGTRASCPPTRRSSPMSGCS